MKIRLPLQQRSVEGISCPFPVVRLGVRDKYDAFAEMDFRVDTQADFTSIPVSTAQREGLPLFQTQERPVMRLVGSELYRYDPEQSESEKPVKDTDHAPDDLRYPLSRMDRGKTSFWKRCLGFDKDGVSPPIKLKARRSKLPIFDERL